MSPTYPTPEQGVNPLAPLEELLHWLASTTLHVALGVLLGWCVARLMRSHQLSWTWAAAALPVWLIARPLFGGLGLMLGAAALRAASRGRRWRREDTEMGATWRRSSVAFRGRWTLCVPSRPGYRTAYVHQGRSWFQGNELAIGKQPDGSLVRIPLGDEAGGTHTFVVGATRSGKTNTMTWIAVRAIEHGMGAIWSTPRAMMPCAATSAGRRRPLACRSSNGPLRATASTTHTLAVARRSRRQAAGWRALVRAALPASGTALHRPQVPAMRQADVVMSLANIVRYLIPNELEALVRHLSGDRIQKVKDYLRSLTQAQRNGLSGVRDRLAIMAESDVGPWLDPETPDAEQIDLLETVKAHAVVYFNLKPTAGRSSARCWRRRSCRTSSGWSRSCRISRSRRW